jgi:hypothetical protein
MLKKSSAHQKKVDKAVWILNTTTGVIIPHQAMILAGFPKKDTANETVSRMICRHLKALEVKQTTPCWNAPTIEEVWTETNNDADLSPLTGKGDDPTASVTTTTKTTHCCHHHWLSLSLLLSSLLSLLSLLS